MIEDYYQKRKSHSKINNYENVKNKNFNYWVLLFLSNFFLELSSGFLGVWKFLGDFEHS